MKRNNPKSVVRNCSTAVGSLFVMALLAGCANAPPPNDAEAKAEYDRANDPIEPWNRHVYSFNDTLDKAVIKPVAENYRTYVPESVRTRIHNAVQNLRSPVIFANDVLQANPDKAYATAGRFLINSLFGVAGMWDVAARDIPRHENDLGETLGKWGVGEGPYLVLPLMGPSNPRDAFGLGVESYADPIARYASNMGYDYTSYIRDVFSGIDRRSENIDTLDEIERTSVDPYSTIRSLYRQYRQSRIDNKPTADKPRPGLAGEFPDTAELSQGSY
jgi:phospholipid-binding lipoprotein MlaA